MDFFHLYSSVYKELFRKYDFFGVERIGIIGISGQKDGIVKAYSLRHARHSPLLP
jgi:hypothetical protein